MYTCAVRPEIAALSAYVPGMSIAEIQEKYGLSKVVKMASNENPLGVSPLVREALGLHAGTAFRYPQGGNPRLVAALARTHGVSPDQVVVGNGSDEIIDMLIRMLLVPGKHSVVCFEPCFSIYPIQAQVCGVEVRRHPLNADFSFDLDALFALVDNDTRLVFVTTPDNPSGYCPPLADVRRLAQRLGERFHGDVCADSVIQRASGNEAVQKFADIGVEGHGVAQLHVFERVFLVLCADIDSKIGGLEIGLFGQIPGICHCAVDNAIFGVNADLVTGISGRVNAAQRVYQILDDQGQ